jgi:hypothetical protein
MDGPLLPALPVSVLMDEVEIERMIAAGPPSSAEEYLLRVRWDRRWLRTILRFVVPKFERLLPWIDQI